MPKILSSLKKWTIKFRESFFLLFFFFLSKFGNVQRRHTFILSLFVLLIYNKVRKFSSLTYVCRRICLFVCLYTIASHRKGSSKTTKTKLIQFVSDFITIVVVDLTWEATTQKTLCHKITRISRIGKNRWKTISTFKTESDPWKKEEQKRWDKVLSALKTILWKKLSLKKD